MLGVNYVDNARGLEKIRWMEGLLADLPSPENQTRLHALDVNPTKWDEYDGYPSTVNHWTATDM